MKNACSSTFCVARVYFLFGVPSFFFVRVRMTINFAHEHDTFIRFLFLVMKMHIVCRKLECKVIALIIDNEQS